MITVEDLRKDILRLQVIIVKLSNRVEELEKGKQKEEV